MRFTPDEDDTVETEQRTPQQRIRDCILEVKTLLSDGIAFHDLRVERAYRDIRETVVSVFGAASRDMHDFEQALAKHPPPGREPNTKILYPQQAHARSLEELLAVLRHLLHRLDPELARSYAVFGLLAFDLHPLIANACVDHYHSGKYRSAVLDASMALRDLVRQQSERSDLDGFDLASTVFAPKNPILAVSWPLSESDRSEQQGLMHLFQGAFLLLRNPRAHSLSPDDPKEAVEYITLLNILAKQLNKVQRTK